MAKNSSMSKTVSIKFVKRDFFNSFNRVQLELYRSLLRLGRQVSIKPPYDFVIDSPYTQYQSRILFTFWESTELPAEYKANINRNFKTVLWTNKSCFKFAPGKSAFCILPVNPQFCNLQINPFVFYSISQDHGIKNRKNVQTVIEAFKKAFAEVQDVRLIIKRNANDFPINTYFDSRIEVIEQPLQDILDIHRRGSVFVSASAGEGWGYPHHDAMALGRPVICGNYLGPTNFLTPACATLLPVTYKKAPAGHPYKGIGKFGYVPVNDLAYAMQQIYFDKHKWLQMTTAAFAQATKFTTAIFDKQIEALL
jgi:glycosyltransferase involved in cell wall biosynthesis